jgi:hypothetical protein
MVTWWEMRCGATKSSNATAYDATGAPVARPRHLLWCMGGGGRHPPHPAATAMCAHPSHHPPTHTHTPSAHLAMAPSVHPCCSQLFKSSALSEILCSFRIKLAVAPTIRRVSATRGGCVDLWGSTHGTKLPPHALPPILPFLTTSSNSAVLHRFTS